MLPAPIPPNAPPPPGTWPLFTFRGIRVFLHWSWVFVAIYHIDSGKGMYPHIGWDIAQYCTLFGIVLLHEFGHSFATRQVGGSADQILLWPFGGIASVRTPPRPGAYLWAIAAGPLVNALLWPVLFFASNYFENNLRSLVPESIEQFNNAVAQYQFARSIHYINTGLLIFNLIPLYPMDGGQLLRGVLWYKFGQDRSQYIAACVGLAVGAGLLLYAVIVWHLWWSAIVLGLMLQQSMMVIRNYRDRHGAGRSAPRGDN